MSPILIARFDAPWCGAVWITSAVAVTALAVPSLVSLCGSVPLPHLVRLILTWAPIGGIAVAGAFAVRGYGLTAHEIRILRPGWTTALPLSGLESITADPQAMRGSIRTFGNGGLFSISGWYRNERLGRYRAFGTDPSRAVVLRYAQHTVVVTPREPGRFVAAVRGLVPPPKTQ